MTTLNTIKKDLFNYIIHDNFIDAAAYLMNQSQIINEIEEFDIDSIVKIYQVLSHETRISSDKKIFLQSIENKCQIDLRKINLFRDLVFTFFQRKYSKCIKVSEELLDEIDISDTLYEFSYFFYLTSLMHCTLYSKAVNIYIEKSFLKNKSPLLQLVGLELNEYNHFLNYPDLLAIDLAANIHHKDSNELLRAKGIIWLSKINLRDYNKTQNDGILQTVKQQHQIIFSTYNNCPEIIQYFIAQMKNQINNDALLQLLSQLPDTKPEKYLHYLDIEPSSGIILFEKNRAQMGMEKDQFLMFYWLKRKMETNEGYNPKNLFLDILKHEKYFFNAYLAYGNYLLDIDINESMKVLKKAFKLQPFAGDAAFSVLQSITEKETLKSSWIICDLIIDNCSSNSIKINYLEFLFNSATNRNSISEVLYIAKKIIDLEDSWLLKNIDFFSKNIDAICNEDSLDKELIMNLIASFVITSNFDSQKKLVHELEVRKVKLNQQENTDIEVLYGIEELDQKLKDFKHREVISTCEKLLEKQWIEMIANICLSAIIQIGAHWRIEILFNKWLEKNKNEELVVFIGNFLTKNSTLYEWNIKLDNLFEILPDSFELYRLMITDAEEGNDIENAKLYCKQAIKKFGNNIWFQWKLGDLLFKTGEKSEAKELWKDIITYGEYQENIYISLVRAYEEEGDDFAIIRLLKTPLRKNELSFQLLEAALLKLSKTKLDLRLEYIALFTIYFQRDDQNSNIFKKNNPVDKLFLLRNLIIDSYKNRDLDESKLRAFSDKIIGLYGSKMILGIWIHENEVVILIKPINYDDQFKNHIGQSIKVKAGEYQLKAQVLYFLDLVNSLRLGKSEMFNLLVNSRNIVDFGTNTAFTIINKHMNLIMNKFEQYLLGYSIFGSFVRGEATKNSDLDAFFILDDTDLQNITRVELKKEVYKISTSYTSEIIKELGVGVELNIQVYLLTEFWLALREGNPLIISILKDSIPFFDKGIIRPWKNLFERGQFIPSKEATDKYLEDSRAIISNLRSGIIKGTLQQLFDSNLMIARAALMSFNIIGTHPRETTDQITKYLCQDKKVISKKSSAHFEEIVTVYKKLEHGEQMNNYIHKVSKYFSDTENFHKEVIDLVKEVKRNNIINEFTNLIIKLNKALHENFSTNIDLLITNFKNEEDNKLSNINKLNDFLIDFIPTYQNFQREKFNLLLMELLVSKWPDIEPLIKLLKKGKSDKKLN
jgi:predicted nucleotidyltransferase